MLRRAWSPLKGFGTLCFLALLPLLLVGTAALVSAQDIRFFRVGTGSTAGTYFPVGGIIASAISSPPGSRGCDRGGSCGVPGLVAVAQSTRGSVDNVRQIRDGNIESGFSQSDIAFWAFRGEEIFQEEGAVTSLRAIANLYPETMHLVVRFDSEIKSLADIKGKRLSLDRKGSGTRVDALLVLKAFGIAVGDLEIVELGSGAAADALREGEIDGFFFVAGTPAAAVQELAEEALVELVPIAGPGAEVLLSDSPFFARQVLAAGTYPGIGETATVSVGAQWLVAETVPEETVYEITRSLWHPSTRQLLDKGHPKGRQIVIEQALEGLGVPLHPGAERYYREMGALQ
ncbi:TAXI family TRAP transporter solute-binding subunit [Pelagibius litoralis]|uniref:TAXI family TRAP transporter solute-binding subunit n=1 Tax=Pelagibius litoralis TaxID=374515 RepID=A0A967CAP2_9PROT|nr:TAXI family TRAP transporter solute-binding subunit [Pelagibius litoralis]NIA67813.1 TAXI family TRAP transporter solute-binding subunit [Pelagibius litoralis]